MRLFLIAAVAASLSATWAAAAPINLPAPTAIAPIPAGAAARPFEMTRTAIALPAGHPWAELQFGFPCLPQQVLSWDPDRNDIGQDADYVRVFNEQVGKAGLSSAGDPNNLFEQSKANAELQIGARIHDIRARFCDPPAFFQPKRQTWSGLAVMAVEWQIYSTLDRKVVARIETRGGGEQRKATENAPTVVLLAAFADNVRGLIASEEFRRLILAPAPTASSSRPGQVPQGAIQLAGAAGAETRKLSDAASAVVAIFAGGGHGSGVLVSRDGYILTNHHVVGGAPYVKVKWADGQETIGEVVRVDAGRDVALVKADPKGRRPLSVRPSGAQLGETVFAIGAPLFEEFQGTLTRGVVSAPDRLFDGRRYIQSDVTVNPGNSGGPLLDEQGAVLGLTVIGIRPDAAPTGINLFIPIDEAIGALNLQPQA